MTAPAHAPVLVAFVVIVGVLLLFGLLAGSDGDDDLRSYYAAQARLTPLRGGLALAGDYVSAVTLLSTTGVIALAGFDGLSIALCSVLALGLLLLIAQPLREAGRFTLGDVLARRLPGRAPRVAVGVATLATTLPFLVVQLAGAGRVTAQLAGATGPGAQSACIALIGCVMTCFAVAAGMRGTNAVQILKVFVVLAALAATAAVLLAQFGRHPERLLTAAARGSGRPDDYLRPGAYRGRGAVERLDFLSLQLTAVLGGACMPHLTMRLGCAPDGATARRSAGVAVAVAGAVVATAAVLGLGAAALVGGPAILRADPSGDAALPLLAGRLGGGPASGAGAVLFTAVACAVFLTALAVVSALTLAAAAALAHDLHAHALRAGRLTEAREVRTARWAVAATGLTGTALALAVHGSNTQFLATFALTAAASSILPATLGALFWPGFGRAGALWALYGGLGCAVLLQALSPTVSGGPLALFPDRDFAWSPLVYPGVVSVPAGFLLAWAGSRFPGRTSRTSRTSRTGPGERARRGERTGRTGRPGRVPG
ncbi:cation acetate symporter [Kitasatospora sp. NPDC057198]|uniref:sodium:solute symporter family transporter n=1 Tax=Kitasatospora sp. NPDC057198 TaxID=3346046 RepID=UPI003642E400